jgi:hypothetical protein
MEAATHQFKFHQNEWRLVGVKIYHISHSTDLVTEPDMNLLTGAVMTELRALNPTKLNQMCDI